MSSPTTLSHILDVTQGKGLVERRRSNGGDARVVKVFATAQGHAITAKIIPLARHYEAVVLTGLSAEETRALETLLVRVYRNIAALEEEAKDATQAP
jgi:DNA-binding MarR family transcriptional regulator